MSPLSSSLPPAAWHARFTLQARWTRDLRQHFYGRLNLRQARRILDVGCGSGILIGELLSQTQSSVAGLDIDPAFIAQARQSFPRASLVQGDALTLPYRNRAFDAALCHFVLLWLTDPLQALREMRRVTCFGGAILVLAEPDYGGRIDHPPALVELGRLQSESLRQQGADPYIGRKLPDLFRQAGLTSIETGLLGGQWSGSPDWETWQSEWSVLEADLHDSIIPIPAGRATCDRPGRLRARRTRPLRSHLLCPGFCSMIDIVKI